jgi:hypothetical protein
MENFDFQHKIKAVFLNDAKNARPQSSLVHFAVQDVHLRTKLKGINQTSIIFLFYVFFQ